MNQFNKDIIAALSSDKDITLNEVLRRQKIGPRIKSVQVK